MADVVFHDMAHKETRQQDAHDRVDQIKVVGLGGVEVVRQEHLYPVYQLLQQQGGQGCADAHHEAQHQDELPVLDVLLAPTNEAGQPAFQTI